MNRTHIAIGSAAFILAIAIGGLCDRMGTGVRVADEPPERPADVAAVERSFSADADIDSEGGTRSIGRRKLTEREIVERAGIAAEFSGSDAKERKLAVFGVLLKSDPQALFRWADSQKNGGSLKDDIMRAWGRFDAPAAIRYANGLEESEGKRPLRFAAVHEWSKFNPEAAYAYVSTLPFEEGGVVTWVAVQQLARLDPEGTLELIESIEDESVWSLAASRTFKEIIRMDARKGWELVFAQSSETQDLLSQDLGRTAVELDIDTALEKLKGFKGEASMQYLWGIVYGAKEKNQWEPLLEQLALSQDPAVRTIAVPHMAFEYAQTYSPEGALEWLQNFEPNSEPHKRAFRNVAEIWTEKDVHSALAWISTLPTGPDQVWAVSGFVHRYKERDPALCCAWVLGTGDPEYRDIEIPKILANWKQRDPSSAEAYAIRENLSQYLPKAP